MALEATCRELGATDVDITAARAPEGRSWRRSGRTAVCGLVCALVVLLDPLQYEWASVSARSASWP